MSILVGVEEADFAYLKQATHASDGNLSTHLTRLETAGLVTIKKGFRGKKPRTTCSITAKGRISFREYLSRMEQIVGLRGRS
jgi:DNA-binding PadR family transcriptional regulator